MPTMHKSVKYSIATYDNYSARTQTDKWPYIVESTNELATVIWLSTKKIKRKKEKLLIMTERTRR